tara:strand:- start:48 stop:173 length:126 start_codon:yes stop_codon:yes gene_type:complete
MGYRLVNSSSGQSLLSESDIVKVEIHHVMEEWIDGVKIKHD